MVSSLKDTIIVCRVLNVLALLAGDLPKYLIITAPLLCKIVVEGSTGKCLLMQLQCFTDL